MPAWKFLGSAALLIGLELMGHPARAQTTVWMNSGTGNWFSTANWSTGAVPTASSFAFIDQGTAFISTSTARAAQFTAGFDATGSVRIDPGGLLAVAGSVLGHSAGSLGTVDVLGGNWTHSLSSDSLWIGNNGTGVVNLRDNGTITLNAGNGWIVLGRLATGAGTLNIGGASGETATAPGIVNGTQITTGNSTGTGTVVLNHTSSNYYLTKTGASGGSAVALTGALALRVENGTSVITGNASHTGGTLFKGGTLRVEGSGTLGSASNSLTVGTNSGDNGSLVLSSGGTATSQLGTVGFSANSTGSVLITGNNSKWSTTNNGLPFVIGRSGTGSVTLTNNGTLDVFGSSGDVNLGALASGNGTLNIGSAVGDAAAQPGIVKALSIYKGSGAGKIVFNHLSSDYFLTTTGGVGGADILLQGGISVQHSAGTTTLRGSNSYSGVTTISGGRLFAGGNSSFGTSGIIINGSGATLGYRPGVAVSNAVTLQASAQLEALAGSDAVQSGSIGESGGSFGFTKVGSGTLVLSGTNTYSGMTILSQGSLRLASNTALGTGTLRIDGLNSTLGYTNAVTSVANDINLQGNLLLASTGGNGATTFSGNISETGSSFSLSISDTLNGGLTLSGTNTHSGGTELISGRLAITTDAALGTTTGILRIRNGTFAITGNSTSSRSLVLDNNGESINAAIEVAPGSTYVTSSALTSNPPLNDASFNFSKTGSGTLVVGGISKTGGGVFGTDIVVAAGTLATTGTIDAAGVLLGNGAALQFGNGGAAAPSSPDLAISPTSGTADVVYNHSESDFQSGLLSGQVRVVQSGSGQTTLNPANTHTAGTEILAGTVVSTSQFMSSGLGTGTVFVDSPGALFAGGTVFGSTTISGTLGIHGPAGSSVAFNQDLTLNTGATLLIRIGDDIFDEIDVDGSITYGGRLQVEFVNGWTPESSGSFNIIDYFGSQSGAFTQIDLPGPEDSGSFDYAGGILHIAVVPEPATISLLLVFGFLAGGFLQRQHAALQRRKTVF